MRGNRPVCDRDCFHCKFDDCINDRLEIEDYLESEKIDKTIIDAPRQKRSRKMTEKARLRKKEYHLKNAEGKASYAKAYYELNREYYSRYRAENRDRKSAYDRHYFEENRERISQKNRAYGEQNKERLRQRHRQWREENREKIRAYQREYYQRKKSAETAEKIIAECPSESRDD